MVQALSSPISFLRVTRSGIVSHFTSPSFMVLGWASALCLAFLCRSAPCISASSPKSKLGSPSLELLSEHWCTVKRRRMRSIRRRPGQNANDSSEVSEWRTSWPLYIRKWRVTNGFKMCFTRWLICGFVVVWFSSAGAHISQDPSLCLHGDV